MKSLHGKLPSSMHRLGPGLELGKLLVARMALGIKLLERVQGS